MNLMTYVGARQWATLLVAEDAFPYPASGEVLREAAKSATYHRNSHGVVESLRQDRMLEHACPGYDHAESVSCQYRITERGRCARLNRRGRKALAQRA